MPASNPTGAAYNKCESANSKPQDFPMNRHHAPLFRRLRSASNLGSQLLLLFAVAAVAAAAGAAESVHDWGLVDWGMTEAQVQSAYGDGVEEYPPLRNRRGEVVELLHLRSPLIINGVALTPSFAFLRTSKGLERVVLRASLTNASSEQCQGTYRRLRQSEINQLAEPIEEKTALRSLHAIWHGAAADAQLSILEVTGHCFVTLVYTRPTPPTTTPDEKTGTPVGNPPVPAH